MATWNFNKNEVIYPVMHLYNKYRPILLHLIIILKLTHLHNRLFSGSNARLLVKNHQKTEDQLQSFDERIINCTYTIQEHLLGIAVCLSGNNNSQRLPIKLDKCRYFGSGKFEFGQ